VKRVSYDPAARPSRETVTTTGWVFFGSTVPEFFDRVTHDAPPLADQVSGFPPVFMTPAVWLVVEVRRSSRDGESK